MKSLEVDDKLIVCCSGGGSACLACPADWISLNDKLGIIKKLQSKVVVALFFNYSLRLGSDNTRAECNSVTP